MDSEEKKIKLDELPDEGSEPFQSSPQPKPRPKTPLDPRKEKIKNFSDAQKHEAMTERWHFDKLKMQWTWVIPLICLLVLEKRKIVWPQDEPRIPKDELAEFSSFLFEFATIMDHPIVLALLIPLFFKFRTSEGLFFELNFSGLDAVRTVDNRGLQPTRAFIKWGDITLANKKIVNRREVIEIHSAKGPEAQLIWDIDDVKKKVVKRVLLGLVSNKHPLRALIEKEVT